MKKKKEVKSHMGKSSKINPVAAGAIGAVVGAVSSAAAIALTDKKKRKKLEDTVTSLKDNAAKSLKKTGEIGKESKNVIERKTKEIEETVSKK